MATSPKQQLDRIGQLETQIDRLSGKVEGAFDRPKKHNPREHADKTRATIAKWFVIGQLLTLPFTLVVTLVYNYLMIYGGHERDAVDLEKIVPLVTSIIGSGVGFVLGYYFKSEEHGK